MFCEVKLLLSKNSISQYLRELRYISGHYTVKIPMTAKIENVAFHL